MLKNVMYKLQNKLPLTIGYFGGSITEGAGATEEKNCWRCLTTKWFCENCPDSEITEVNAGIGGTGSDLGIFRCDLQVTEKNCDLVFIEFAVNDWASDVSFENMETIIRKIMTANPLTDMVLIVTTSKAIYDANQADTPQKSLITYERLSKYYGIDIVNVGEEVNSRVASGDCEWDKYINDSCHPNDNGYRLYADTIIKYLKANLKIPYALTTEKYINAEMTDAASSCETNFDITDETLCGRWPGMIVANQKGKYLEFKFTGTTVGIYMMTAKDSGDFLWSVDGETPKRESTWDKYAIQFDRAHYRVLTRDLEYGEHTLRIEVLGECNEQSEGTYIRIAAFLTA